MVSYRRWYDQQYSGKWKRVNRTLYGGTDSPGKEMEGKEKEEVETKDNRRQPLMVSYWVKF